jgi:hypothetical protein
MSNPKHCAECEQIVAEMWAAFLKLMPGHEVTCYTFRGYS